jgi:hypothetical protein
MDNDVEALFERLSEKYVARVTEERKLLDEKQLQVFKSAIEEWTHNKRTEDNKTGDSAFSEHDLIRGVLVEAKERQSKVLMVFNILLLFD